MTGGRNGWGERETPSNNHTTNVAFEGQLTAFVSPGPDPAKANAAVGRGREGEGPGKGICARLWRAGRPHTDHANCGHIDRR